MGIFYFGKQRVMIFFYRVKDYGVRLPAGQWVYVTPAQRQNYQAIVDLKAGDYAEPGWYAVLSPYESLVMGWGELFGLRGTLPPERLAGLRLEWVRESQGLGYRMPTAAMCLNWEHLRDLSRQRFEETTGMSFSDFHQATTKLTRGLWEMQGRGGRKARYGVEDQLYVALMYRQGQQAYRALAKRYGLSVSRFYQMVKWVEEMLGWSEREAEGVSEQNR